MLMRRVGIPVSRSAPGEGDTNIFKILMGGRDDYDSAPIGKRGAGYYAADEPNKELMQEMMNDIRLSGGPDKGSFGSPWFHAMTQDLVRPGQRVTPAMAELMRYYIESTPYRIEHRY